MVNRILKVNSDVFDANTGNFIGKAQFEMPSDSEHELLDYINYNIVPHSMVLLDVNIYEPSENYAAPEPFQSNQRAAVLYGVARDQDSGAQMPFELHLKYSTVARGNLSENVYHADSIQLSNIKPIAINWVQLKP